MEKILESIKGFLMTGNNLSITIILSSIVLFLIVAVIIASIKKKRVEKKVAEEEAMIAEEENSTNPTAIETIVLSPIVDEEIVEESGAIVVNNETASQIADETVIMTPVREKKRPQKIKVEDQRIPQEKKSSFGDPMPSSEDGKLPGSVHIYRDKNNKYRFKFRSSNKFTIGHSQAYTAKSACKSGIQAVVRAASTATILDVNSEDYVSLIGKSSFEIYKDKENKFRFRLMSANAMNILASQGYASRANCLKGIESIKRIAEYHTIVDDTKE